MRELVVFIVPVSDNSLIYEGLAVFIVPVSDNTLIYEGVGGIYRPC
jgi:DNA-dependent RNA polymerase auxiliary subunit epsilon